MRTIVDVVAESEWLDSEKPYTETIVAHDADGVRTDRAPEPFEHPRLPGFTFEIEALFREGDDL